VLYQWKNHVMPAYQKYLLPFMSNADIIINNNTHFENSLTMLANHFRQIILSSQQRA
jgi:uridine kinase